MTNRVDALGLFEDETGGFSGIHFEAAKLCKSYLGNASAYASCRQSQGAPCPFGWTHIEGINPLCVSPQGDYHTPEVAWQVMWNNISYADANEFMDEYFHPDITAADYAIGIAAIFGIPLVGAFGGALVTGGGIAVAEIIGPPCLAAGKYILPRLLRFSSRVGPLVNTFTQATSRFCSVWRDVPAGAGAGIAGYILGTGFNNAISGQNFDEGISWDGILNNALFGAMLSAGNFVISNNLTDDIPSWVGLGMFGMGETSVWNTITDDDITSEEFIISVLSGIANSASASQGCVGVALTVFANTVSNFLLTEVNSSE